jgi:hypothetical protein
MRWGNACSTHGVYEKCIKIFAGKSEGKSQLKSSRRNVEMYNRKGYEDVSAASTGSVWGPVVQSFEKDNELSCPI